MRLTIPPRFLVLAGLISPFCQYTFTLLSPKGDKIHKFHSKNETKTAKKIMFSWSEMAGFTAPALNPPLGRTRDFYHAEPRAKAPPPKCRPLVRCFAFCRFGPLDRWRKPVGAAHTRPRPPA